ncbi:sigma-70 family RNA polymerase sigma factor [Streptomyces sp. NPDC051776]|uniref:sigma-70 family RNA polymerase sigma factor n=1 Tax=Streptomyces sp. NPDC051776 TaxID=3155414 RepID=UPI0034366517
MGPAELLTAYRPLLAAEAEAEAYGTGVEPGDLEQGVWLRLLERTRTTGPPPAPAAWLLDAVRTEARGARHRARREVPYDGSGSTVDSTDGREDPWMPRGAAGSFGADAVGEEEEDGKRGEETIRDPGAAVEDRVLAAETRRAVHAAVARLPGRCPRLLAAMLSPKDPTYREVAGELGISQGSLGPVRSRCLGCLRRMLLAEVAVADYRGRER